jgi:flagellin
MPLGVLNNISAIYAENNLNQTQSSLQKTLTELSSGSRINSGADDSAGLAIANGLQANSSALTQSSANATAGVGFLQVADGALSQVTNLLNRAVTLATEAGGGTLSATQMSAADQEYQDILGQINTIGSTTEYNGIQVFSSDQTVTALGWGANAVGSSTSATATSGAIAAAAITAGGAATVAAPVQTATYGSAANMSWSLNGTASTSTLTSSVIPNGGKLSGTLAFSPTTSGGTASAISIDLTQVTGGTLSAQATSLATLINAQAGNSGGDYTVTAVGNNQLQIGLGANATTDHITGFSAAPATGSTTGGAAAAQTGFTLAVADGGTLGGSIAVTANTTVAAGAQTTVNFTNNGATITANLPPADNIGGSITIGGTIPQTGGVATALGWSSSGSGAAETFSAAVDTSNTLSGSFTITGTGDNNSPYTINLSGLQGQDASAIQTTVLSDITSGGGTASDYTVSYSNGTLTIGLSGGGSETGIAVANTGGSAATQTTPIVNPGGTTSPNKTIDLTNVTTANLQSTLNADLAGSDYSATYNSGTGALTFSISGAGTTAGVTALTISGSPSVFKQTPASVTPGSTTNISLANVTTANLASVVATALNGVNPSNPDYTVSYSSGTLTVGLTAHGTTTDNIASLSLASTATEKSPTAASIQFTDGEQLSGQFSITPTVSGVAASPITVNLNGHSTSDLVATVSAALNANSPGSASNYNVAYNVSNGVGTLSIAANATGLAANVDSVAIANGTSTNAMGYSGVAMTSINPANTVMGNFTVTPTTASGSGSAVNVNLQGVTNANLLSTVQTALGSSYTVAYDTTANSPTLGRLSISVSSAGAAAGITGFTVAEASSQAASQETAAAGGVSIYTSDGTSTGSKNYNVTVGQLSNASVGTSSSSSVLGSQFTVTVGGVTGTGGVAAGGTTGTSLISTNLTSQANAEAALQTVDNAISAVAYQRGQVGANINTLTAASNIASSEQTNITSAENAITATDYAATTSNMSKFEILTQTGISALAQANSTQQMVTKLLQ